MPDLRRQIASGADARTVSYRRHLCLIEVWRGVKTYILVSVFKKRCLPKPGIRREEWEG